MPQASTGSIQIPASSRQDHERLSSETHPPSAVESSQNPVDPPDVVRRLNLLSNTGVSPAHVGSLRRSTLSLVKTTGRLSSPVVTGANLLHLHAVLFLE
jgi:hypothetical protein